MSGQPIARPHDIFDAQRDNDAPLARSAIQIDATTRKELTTSCCRVILVLIIISNYVSLRNHSYVRKSPSQESEFRGRRDKAVMMKPVLKRAPLLLLVLPTIACGAAPLHVSPAVAEREIIDIERAWDNAEVHRDRAALDAILDDRFVLTFGDEPPMDKAAVMKNVMANDNPSPSTTSEERIIVDGDVAILLGVSTFERVVDGKRVKRANRGTTTFVQRNGRWRALAVQMVRLP